MKEIEKNVCVSMCVCVRERGSRPLLLCRRGMKLCRDEKICSEVFQLLHTRGYKSPSTHAESKCFAGAVHLDNMFKIQFCIFIFLVCLQVSFCILCVCVYMGLDDTGSHEKSGMLELSTGLGRVGVRSAGSWWVWMCVIRGRRGQSGRRGERAAGGGADGGAQMDTAEKRK